MSSSIARRASRHSVRPQDGPLNIQYGHTDTLLVMKFTRVTDHISLTVRQADDMIAALKQVKDALAHYQAKQDG